MNSQSLTRSAAKAWLPGTTSLATSTKPKENYIDVFGKGTAEPSRPLLPPGICWVCSNSPQQEAMKVIDTRRNTQAGGTLSHASNRIYVCEPCIDQLAGALGFVPRDEYESVVDKLRDSDLELSRVQTDLREAQSSQVRVVSADDVLAKLDKLTAPKPRAPRSTNA